MRRPPNEKQYADGLCDCFDCKLQIRRKMRLFQTKQSMRTHYYRLPDGRLVSAAIDTDGSTEVKLLLSVEGEHTDDYPMCCELCAMVESCPRKESRLGKFERCEAFRFEE